MENTLEEGWCLALGQHLLSKHMKRDLVPSPLGRSWSSLPPDPAGGCEEVVSANEDEKHTGWVERERPNKISTLRGMSSPLLCAQDPAWT